MPKPGLTAVTSPERAVSSNKPQTAWFKLQTRQQEQLRQLNRRPSVLWTRLRPTWKPPNAHCREETLEPRSRRDAPSNLFKKESWPKRRRLIRPQHPFIVTLRKQAHKQSGTTYSLAWVAT